MLRGLPKRFGRTQAVLGAMLAVLPVAAPRPSWCPSRRELRCPRTAAPFRVGPATGTPPLRPAPAPTPSARRRP